jgi:hypothetical protein
VNTPKENFGNASSSLRKEDLSEASIIEVREKEARLRRFYAEQEIRRAWVFPNHTLNYLRKYQFEGSKRKDLYTEDCLHQIEPALWLANLYQAGVLPERVTYQIIGGDRYEIDPSMQSIEHLFDSVHFHDVDEDFWDASRDTLEDYLRKVLPEDKYFKTIAFLGDASDAITFGRKIDPIGTKEKTHDDDPQVYIDAMENIWTGMATKGADRLGGLITRFGILEKIFPYEKQKEYLNDSNRLFFHRQTLEDMERRYPELGEYFHLVNCNISIALRCFSVILDNHPENPDRNKHPEKARINLDKDLLDGAFAAAENVPIDIAPMKRMLMGYKALVSRVALFEPIVAQIEEQLTPYLELHPRIVPRLDNKKICPRITYS